MDALRVKFRHAKNKQHFSQVQKIRTTRVVWLLSVLSPTMFVHNIGAEPPLLRSRSSVKANVSPRPYTPRAPLLQDDSLRLPTNLMNEHKSMAIFSPESIFRYFLLQCAALGDKNDVRVLLRHSSP